MKSIKEKILDMSKKTGKMMFFVSIMFLLFFIHDTYFISVNKVSPRKLFLFILVISIIIAIMTITYLSMKYNLKKEPEEKKMDIIIKRNAISKKIIRYTIFFFWIISIMVLNTFDLIIITGLVFGILIVISILELFFNRIKSYRNKKTFIIIKTTIISYLLFSSIFS